MLQKNQPAQEEQAETEDLSLTSPLHQQRQIKSAIKLLENGRLETANEFLSEVLAINPNNASAKFLKSQLDLPIENIDDYFETTRFTEYTLEKNDTLAELAEEWLDNSLYFVILARLNNIKNPLQLKPSTKIKIPVLASSQLVKNEKLRSNANLQLIADQMDKRDFVKALKKVNRLFILESDMSELSKLQKKLLEKFAKSSISFSEREKMIESISTLKPNARNKKHAQVYQQFVYENRRELLLDEASLLFDDQSYIDAASKLAQVKQMDEDMKKQHDSSLIEKPLLDKLHEKAVTLYSQNDFKNALNYWKLILGVQPNNELAQKYIQRTEILLEKLNKL
jgi:tetratricopeptide (TPR) repeat protein